MRSPGCRAGCWPRRWSGELCQTRSQGCRGRSCTCPRRPGPAFARRASGSSMASCPDPKGRCLGCSFACMSPNCHLSYSTAFHTHGSTLTPCNSGRPTSTERNLRVSLLPRPWKSSLRAWWWSSSECPSSHPRMRSRPRRPSSRRWPNARSCRGRLGPRTCRSHLWGCTSSSSCSPRTCLRPRTSTPRGRPCSRPRAPRSRAGGRQRRARSCPGHRRGRATIGGTTLRPRPRLRHRLPKRERASGGAKCGRPPTRRCRLAP
mmetsp:Transcript_71763/g.181056  ORF Transcript_71763/g.181056 Transcript_71763/m.181056 type:complete len:261 (-) Transcript_71763:168-950(-)